ncbi:MAG: PilZ domain-containing protein [Thermodesulfobacteriota bacterium]
MANHPKQPAQNNDLSAITANLFGIILKMSLEERRELLAQLETQQNDKKRQHPRRDYFMVVEYAVEDRLFSGYIKNISPGGLFIEMDLSEKLTPGQRLTLTFTHPDTGEHIKTHGEIVRIENSGIGVHFDNMIPLFGQAGA